MTDLVELKPCPFCGSADVELRESITDAMVACNNCGSRTGFVYLGASDAANANKIKECVGIWNTRALEQSTLENKELQPKLVAYEDAHAVAAELGYPSLTEALEALERQAAEIKEYREALSEALSVAEALASDVPISREAWKRLRKARAALNHHEGSEG